MNKETVKKLLKIFFATFRIGLVTFGGGGSMTLMLQRTFVDKYHWMDDDTFVDVLAVARSLPGVVSVNTSTIAGYQLMGTAGGVAAGIGCALPSLLILIVVTVFYDALRESVFFANALRGVRGVVVALLAATVIRLRPAAIKDIYGHLIFWGILILSLAFRNVNIVFYICGSLLLGMVIYYWNFFRKKDRL